MKVRWCKTLWLAIVFAVLPAHTLMAADQAPATISWAYLIIGLFGGLALFLYGMDKMSEGMKKSAGNQMRAILAALTRNRLIALLVGAFVTMVIQSSSATTVMLVSFVQAGLMSFAQTLGVILGADIGTTVTAQLIAFKLTDYALLMISIGFGLRMFSKSENIRNIGEVILGFGILFFGMKLMSDAMKPLRTYQNFIEFLERLENPLLGILSGAVFTALIQSSSAFTGVLIVLAQQGLISLEAGIPMIFGANIGTCVTALLAAIGKPREAIRAADPAPTVILMDGESMNGIDATAAVTLKELQREMTRAGREIWLARMKTEVLQVMERADLMDSIPKEHIFLNIQDGVEAYLARN